MLALAACVPWSAAEQVERAAAGDRARARRVAARVLADVAGYVVLVVAGAGLLAG